MDEEPNTTKILSLPEEFAKAKRNLLFWCALTLAVMIAHVYEPDDVQRLKLIFVDASIPFWVARTAAFAIGSFMFIGFWRSVARVDIVNSTMARHHDAPETDKLFKDVIQTMHELYEAEQGAAHTIRDLKERVAGFNDLRSSPMIGMQKQYEARLNRIRETVDNRSLVPSQMIRTIETEMSSLLDDINDRILSVDQEARDAIVVPDDGQLSSLRSLNSTAVALEQRLGELTSFAASIDSRDIRWLTWWDKRVPVAIYGATAISVIIASLAT